MVILFWNGVFNQFKLKIQFKVLTKETKLTFKFDNIYLL